MSRVGWAGVAVVALAITACGARRDRPVSGTPPASGDGPTGGDVPPGGTPPTGGEPPGGGTPDTGGTPGTGGTPETGGTPPPGGGAVGGLPKAFDVTHRSSEYRLLAVGPDGTAFGQQLGDLPERLYASADGRTWTVRGTHPAARRFFVVAPLGTGTLLADTIGADNGHALSRSADGGRTWADVLPLGRYRLLTPASVAELHGDVLVLEYQAFTASSVPIRLWASADDGVTWTVRSETTTHRHGHGLLADPAQGALWLMFGDLTGGSYLSFDGGRTSTLVRGPYEGGVLVQAVATPDGLLGGLDAVYQPLVPGVVSLSFGGAYEARSPLPGPSYSIRALPGGWVVTGTAREPGGDVYPAGDVSAHVFASPDGHDFHEVFSCERLTATDAARADVAGQLPSGEVAVSALNCAGFGGGGAGYVLLAPP
jgi:hypothetical protein